MEDYKSAHLAWIKATKTFTCKYPQDIRPPTTYYDVIRELYNNPVVTQQHAKRFFIDDKKWFRESQLISKEIDKSVNAEVPKEINRFFVTIGFNHQTWSISKCVKVIENILDMKWVKSAKANFELHRENGEHPHVHFVIETDEPKSRLLEKMFRPNYVKEVVLNKSFIDCKVMAEYHLKYILLDKTEDKMDYVRKDIEWRKKNKIPDFEKNWENVKGGSL